MKNNGAWQAFETLRDAKKSPYPESWIRIGMDTGGIAAGADRLHDQFRTECAEAALETSVLRAGSYGYAWIDPLVEVKATGDTSPVLYGIVDEEVATRIVNEHFMQGRLVDGHVIAPRVRGEAVDEATTAILVQDTSREDGDKTRFVQSSLEDEIKVRGLEGKIQVVRALDMGIYHEGLVVQLLPSGVTYTNVLSRDITRIVEESVVGHRVIDDLLWKSPDLQERIVLRNCGIVDPESLEDALRRGVYEGFARALSGDPETVIAEVKESGLRGRGGAGFPTGMKWELTRKPKAERKFVICNADEGDPGAFMDRSILEGDPHSVLEGLILAAYAIGAEKGYFYIRAEYPLAVARVGKAIAAARERGLLGENILGSGWSFDAEIRLGAGAFVCGEETALIASIEGKRGSPEPRPPYPSVKGLWGMPTCINNVETLACVPWILNHGGTAYAGLGMEKSRGTKVFAVTGKVANPQLVEVPMGTTVSDIIYGICGGVQDDIPVKGVQTGGPSGGIIPEKHLETPVTYENLQALGSIMGSGGMLVMDENDCMVDVSAFYLKFCVDESCGKCAPCRVGGYQMLQLLLKVSRGRGKPEDLEQIRRICNAMHKASLCGLGQTAPNPILSSLRYFEDEYIAYIEGGTSYARKRKRALAEGKSLKPAV